MRTILICAFMFYLSGAKANIEYAEEKSLTANEISQNRACFEELAKNGCEDPGVNVREFRKCLHDVFPKLTDGCAKMMSNLYRRRE